MTKPNLVAFQRVLTDLGIREGDRVYVQSSYDQAKVWDLSPEEIVAVFDLSQALKHVDTIFARVFGEGGYAGKSLRDPKEGDS
jgi:hypothetical protein